MRMAMFQLRDKARWMSKGRMIAESGSPRPRQRQQRRVQRGSTAKPDPRKMDPQSRFVPE
jgi:hypothetical protein